MRRGLIVVLPTLGLVGLIFFITLAAPYLFQRSSMPIMQAQPIDFNHQLHVQAVGIDCQFCHRTAAQASMAGIPDVQTCMACHSVVTGQQGVSELRQAWIDQEPIDWQRVHQLPDHVNFVHSAHIQAGFTCQTCHGDVGQMQQVIQVRPLKMADCVTCHRANGASADCATCHK